MRRVLTSGCLSLLDTPLELDPQVALRPEPFGALAYHYGKRRLVFLKHPDVVAVARQLDQHPSLRRRCRRAASPSRRWPSFAKAFASLNESEIVRERRDVG